MGPSFPEDFVANQTARNHFFVSDLFVLAFEVAKRDGIAEQETYRLLMAFTWSYLYLLNLLIL